MRPIKEIRHDNLLRLIDEAKSTSDLATKTGIAVSYLLQIKNKNAIQNGKPKGIGDKIAAKLEDGMNKPRGWLDIDHSSSSAFSYNTAPTIYLKDNLHILLNKKGLDLELLINRAKVEKNRLIELLDAESISQSDMSIIQAIASVLIVSPETLLYSDISTNPKGINFLKIRETPVNQVPIRSYAQLGTEGHWVDLEYPVGQGDGYIWWPSKDPEAYALKCQGDSMQPRIKHNEYAIIEPNHHLNNGDEVLVVTTGGEVMIKIYAYEQGGRITLLSVNEAHEPLHYFREEIEKMHYLAGIAKESLVIDL